MTPALACVPPVGQPQSLFLASHAHLHVSCSPMAVIVEDHGCSCSHPIHVPQVIVPHHLLSTLIPPVNLLKSLFLASDSPETPESLELLSSEMGSPHTDPNVIPAFPP